MTDSDLDVPAECTGGLLFRNCFTLCEWLIENRPREMTHMVVPAGEWDKAAPDVPDQLASLLRRFHPVVWRAHGISTSTLIGHDWVAAFRRGRAVTLVTGRAAAAHAFRLLIDSPGNAPVPIRWEEYLAALQAGELTKPGSVTGVPINHNPLGPATKQRRPPESGL